MDVILDGKPSLEARFAEIDTHLVRQEFLNIGMTLEHADKIAAFETTHRAAATMYEPVDVFIADAVSSGR